MRIWAGSGANNGHAVWIYHRHVLCDSGVHEQCECGHGSSIVRGVRLVVVTASNPWQGHDFAVLSAVLLAGPATLVAATVYLCSRFTRQARRRRTPTAVWRDASLTAVTVALALYVWGCLHVLFLEDQEQAEACERARPAGVPTLIGIRGDFIPLRLV